VYARCSAVAGTRVLHSHHPDPAGGGEEGLAVDRHRAHRTDAALVALPYVPECRLTIVRPERMPLRWHAFAETVYGRIDHPPVRAEHPPTAIE
jgi:hypothetical protein